MFIFCPVKESLKRNKIQVTKWDRIFANYKCNKWLISKI